MSRKWSQWELGVLKEQYPDNLTESIVGLFNNRSYAAISSKAFLMGLKKSDAFFNSEKSRRLTTGSSVATQFKKGHQSWNKGKKLLDYIKPELLEKMQKNQFKKGQEPHNKVAIGFERITVEGYIEVKVRNVERDGKNKNFELKQRLVWESVNGPIPKNYIVIFKDGNKQNCAIENLEIVSRRENMLRNTYSDKAIVKRFFKLYDPEIVDDFIQKNKALIEQKRQTLLLTVKINQKKCKSK